MEERYKETHATWDKIAHRYEEKFMELDLYDATYKRFCDLLPKSDASVLEIGCGPGNITRHLSNLNPGLSILATDISTNMVQLAKRNNPGVDVQVLDCRNLNSLNTRFEGIICGFTIPFLSQHDCAIMLAECSRLLAESGVLYLSFVAGDSSHSCFKKATTEDRVYFHYHELDTIKQDLALNHLAVEDIFTTEFQKADGESETHTVLVAIKRANDAV